MLRGDGLDAVVILIMPLGLVDFADVCLQFLPGQKRGPSGWPSGVGCPNLHNQRSTVDPAIGTTSGETNARHSQHPVIPSVVTGVEKVHKDLHVQSVASDLQAGWPRILSSRHEKTISQGLFAEEELHLLDVHTRSIQNFLRDLGHHRGG